MPQKTGYRVSVVILFSSILIIAACSSSQDPTKAEWLFGTWELSYNPENDDSDLLEFSDDGTVTIKTQHDELVHGKYIIAGDTLKLTLKTPRKIIDVDFEISGDKSRLNYHTGAYYTRRQ